MEKISGRAANILRTWAESRTYINAQLAEILSNTCNSIGTILMVKKTGKGLEKRFLCFRRATNEAHIIRTYKVRASVRYLSPLADQASKSLTTSQSHDENQAIISQTCSELYC